jgi:hypothetical protein
VKRSPWLLASLLILAACGSSSPAVDAGPGGSRSGPQIVATIEVGRMYAISAGAGGLWTANYEEGTVSLVDPRINEVVETIRVKDEENRGFLWRVDPETMAQDPEPLTMDGEFQSADLTYGFDSIWVSHDTNLLTRIDVSGSAGPSEPPPSPEPRGDAEVCDQRGAWVDCPEARWLRCVVAEAGFSVTGDAGTALEIAAQSHNLYAWNTDANRPVEDVASDEGYQPRQGTEAFSDGHRILWEAQGLHIYISSADGYSIEILTNDLIDRLVQASRVTPRAADPSGANPQPTPTGDQRFERAADGRVRVWPATEDVENAGKYLFTAPHCGLDWMIDFDASFGGRRSPTITETGTTTRSSTTRTRERSPSWARTLPSTTRQLERRYN